MTGRELKALRHQLAYAQREMAHPMGISRSYYADLECGRRRITEELEMLATTWATIVTARRRRQPVLPRRQSLTISQWWQSLTPEERAEDEAWMAWKWNRPGRYIAPQTT